MLVRRTVSGTIRHIKFRDSFREPQRDGPGDLHMTTALRIGGLGVLLILGAATATAADWPQWLGPDRNGASPEKGLLTTWPAGGPKVLWKVEGGDGYSAVSVVGKRAYTLVQRGDDELAIALNVA